MSGIDIDPGPLPTPPQPRPVRVAGLTSEFDRVNVLMIVEDDLGIEQLRAFGIDTTNTYARCPDFVEWMVANGVRFPRFYSQPVCSPTRAAYLTGRYPFRTGLGQQVTSAQNALSLAEMCLPRAITLGTADRYRIAGFGKWHLSNWMNGENNHPSSAGFERFVMTMANLERGDDDYFSHRVIDDGVQRHSRKYATQEIVDDALAWLGKVEEPWFCYIAMHAVHEPIHRPPDHYDTDTYVLPNTEPQGLEDPRPCHKAMQQNSDYHKGRLIRGIRPEAFANTMVFYLSDNGTSGGLLPDIDGGVPPGHNKGSVFEMGVRVPLMVAGPGVDEPGRSCPHLVSCVDLYPTIAAVCGADLAQAPSAGTVDGVSFLNVLRNRNAPPPRTSVFVEHFSPNGQNNDAVIGSTTPGGRAMIGPKYKVITRVPGLIGANSHIFPQVDFPAGTAAANETDLMYNVQDDVLEAAASLLGGGFPGTDPMLGGPSVILTQEEWDAYQALKTAHNTLTTTIP